VEKRLVPGDHLESEGLDLLLTVLALGRSGKDLSLLVDVVLQLLNKRKRSPRKTRASRRRSINNSGFVSLEDTEVEITAGIEGDAPEGCCSKSESSGEG